MKKGILILSAFLVMLGVSASSPKDKFRPDYIKAQMIKTARWQLNNPWHELCDWTNGAFYPGLFAAWETTKESFIYDAMMYMGEMSQWRPCDTGPMDRANDVAIGQTFIDLYRIEKNQEMITPLTDTLKAFMFRPYNPRGHKVQTWWWCDALFMEPPTLVKLGVTLNDEKFLKYNDQKYKECYNLLYDKEEHLFARDNMYVIKGDGKDKYEANGKKVFWGRGNGWVVAGLAKILTELPARYPERPFYEKLFKEMCTKIASIQQEDGLWRTSLLDPASFPGGEVSGSGFFCYALAWGINNGLLDKKTFLPVVEKAWIGLDNNVNAKGRVGWVQPIGDYPVQNFNKNSWEVFGTGAYLLAASEVIKLKR